MSPEVLTKRGWRDESRSTSCTGEDPGLVSQELATVLESALTALDESGLGDALEEYGAPGQPEETLEIGAVLNACRTPPFFSNVRIVVVRDVGALDASAQRELVAYLDEPLETTILVLVRRLGRTARRRC